MFLARNRGFIDIHQGETLPNLRLRNPPHTQHISVRFDDELANFNSDLDFSGSCDEDGDAGDDLSREQSDCESKADE